MFKQALVAATTGAVLASQASAYFILQGGTLALDRQDAIVSPGVNVVAQHVHNLVGGSSINSNSTFESLLNSKCTSLPVTVDKSAYSWQPNLYYYNPNDSTFQSIPSGQKIYYLQRPGPKKEKLVAFPPGFRMVAGNPNRKTYDPKSFADQAINFVCQDYAGGHQGDPEWEDRPTFFNHNCPNGMRAQVVFPSCWNGKDLYKTDNSHVAYPIQAVNTGDCPSSHPVHLITLFHEFVYDVAKFPFNGNGTITWVFANGDTTGLSLHADFLNGWDVSVLQEAIDQCTGEIGGNLQYCAPLAPYLDTQAANACRIESDLVDEDVGEYAPISELPGCNLLWSSGPKPSCPPTAVPGHRPAKSIPAAGYSYAGCMAEPDTGRSFTGNFFTASNMTGAVCTAGCAAGGFEWAGVEYGNECRCGSTFSNGGTNTTVAESRCGSVCPGNNNEECGGSRTMSVYRNPKLAVDATPALPSGWKAAGCVADNVNSSRTLSGYTFASSGMTIQSCVSTCSGRGFAYAGVEYGRECWCSNTPKTLQTSNNCNMACAGDVRYTCGGSNALTLFTNSAAPAPGYAAVGCVAEGSTGRLLTGASSFGDDMTLQKCTSFCAQNGLMYAGAEYGRECYCGSSFNNGGDGSLIDASRCSVACKGDDSTICGGGNALSLFRNPALAPVAESIPAGWSALGCLVDNFNSTRTLSTYRYTSGSMTNTLCINKCQSLNYRYAGTEYSSECYCSNTLTHNANSIQCSMPCLGAKGVNCGGPDALTAFVFNAPAKTARHVKLSSMH